MNRLCRSLALAAAAAIAVLASPPARADHYTLDGRFECLDHTDATCGGAISASKETDQTNPAPGARPPRQSRVEATPSALEKLLASTGLDVERMLAKLDAAPVAEGGPFIALDDARMADFNKARQEDLEKLARMLPLASPLDSYQVDSGFGPRIDPINHRPSFHPGIDLSAPYRSPVYSTAPGTVIFTGTKEGYGRTVDIDHGRGIVTRYAHLHRILVAPGQRVGVHAEIGELGSSGRTTGPHVHYEVRVDDTPVDPAKFMAAGRGGVEIGLAVAAPVTGSAARRGKPRPMPPVSRQVFYQLLQVEDHVLSGRPTTSDIETLKTAARAGDAHATDLLAWCEFDGLGTSRDPVDAYLLYGIAALAKVPHADENEAMIYDTVLTPEQRRSALDAAQAGLSAAQIIAGD